MLANHATVGIVSKERVGIIPRPFFRPWTPEEQLASMEATLRHWHEGDDVWVYAYGSLIWRPEFEYQERRLATLRGYHRALCLWSRVNRGTPEAPGLVFGLERGGSCRGIVYRLQSHHVRHFFPALWQREMTTGAYHPRWLSCHTSAGYVTALVFTMNRASTGYIPTLPEAEILTIIRRARGRYGTCLDYVTQTAQALKAAGIHDTRLVQLTQRLDTPCPPVLEG